MSNNFELAHELFDAAMKLKPVSDEEAYEYHPAIMGKWNGDDNLLHFLAAEFMQYPHGFKFLERVAKEKSLHADLKKMSLHQDNEGLTPFLVYFREVKNTF